MTVTLTEDDLGVIREAVTLATQELEYRVENLDDTGDYEPEDIQKMRDDIAAYNALYERLTPEATA